MRIKVYFIGATLALLGILRFGPYNTKLLERITESLVKVRQVRGAKEIELECLIAINPEETGQVTSDYLRTILKVISSYIQNDIVKS